MDRQPNKAQKGVYDFKKHSRRTPAYVKDKKRTILYIVIAYVNNCKYVNLNRVIWHYWNTVLKTYANGVSRCIHFAERLHFV